MEDWIKWTEVAANVATAFGITGLAIFYFTHQENQKQFKFGVMLHCIERYQSLIPLEIEGSYNLLHLRMYVDLTSEEFFYFQQSYIPKEVMIEWLDSIVQNFPVYVPNQDLPINYEALAKEIHDKGNLIKYARLLKAFKVNLKSNDFDLVSVEGKTRLIKEIASNLGISLKNKHFKGAIIS